jgi:YaiO family outer membrane protein
MRATGRKLPAVVGLMALSLALSSVSLGQNAAADASAVSAAANLVSESEPKPLNSYVESGGDYMSLTNGYGSWAGAYTRAVYEHGNDVWNGELSAQREFGDAGAYFAAGDTHTINPDWYASLTIGTSAGGFFFPRFRTDAFLNKKWLKRKQWITTAGFGYYDAKDVHRDSAFYFGSTYYFEKPWIVESGMYFNISDPGTIFAPAGFLAVTQGRNKHQYIVVRAGFGEEAYQLVGPSVALTQFESQTLTVTWRKWIGNGWGFNFVGDYYHSPYYTRGGSSFGFFKEF